MFDQSLSKWDTFEKLLKTFVSNLFLVALVSASQGIFASSWADSVEKCVNSKTLTLHDALMDESETDQKALLLPPGPSQVFAMYEGSVLIPSDVKIIDTSSFVQVLMPSDNYLLPSFSSRPSMRSLPPSFMTIDCKVRDPSGNVWVVTHFRGGQKAYLDASQTQKSINEDKIKALQGN